MRRRTLTGGSAIAAPDTHIDLPSSKSKKRRFRKLEASPLLRLWFRHAEVEAAFGRIEERWGGEPLFPNPLATGEDRRWTETSEKRTLSRAYKVAGIEPIRPNELGSANVRCGS